MNTNNGTIEKKIKNSGRRAFVRLGYSKLETAELVESLNQLLANYSVHYQKLRNFHWNVKGADFFDMHEQFEVQYEYANKAIDEIAERIRVFGQTPLSTMQSYLNTAEIKEVPAEMTSMEMVKEIISDYEILLEYMFGSLEMAIEHGDSGTEDMIKSFIKTVEKNHWMMTSFLNEN